MIDWILVREADVPPLGMLQLYRVYLPAGERSGVPAGLPDGLYLGARLHGPPGRLMSLLGPLTESEASKEVETSSPTDWINRLMRALEESETLDGDLPNDGVRH